MLNTPTINYSEKRFTFEKLLFPVALIGMTGSAITFLRSICTGNMRWVILIFLFFFLLVRKNFFRLIDARFGFILFSYLIWCFLTSFWAAVPLLSFMKSGIYVIAVLTMIRAGIEWVKINKNGDVLDYLWVLSFVTLAAGFMGKFSNSHWVNINGENANIVMFQGFAVGANMFGTLLAMAFPYFLWKSYNASPHKKRLFWSFLTISCFYFLLISFSRGAMLVVFLTLSGFLCSLSSNKKTTLICITFSLVLCLPILVPSVLDSLIALGQKFLFKGFTGQFFHSREELWQHSIDGAREGGWFGLGFGMIPDLIDFDISTNGLSVYMYGKERGNSHLVMIQETGIVSFVLYLLLISSLSIKLLNLYLRERETKERVLVGILSGIFLGMIAHSIFEGWWTSPGAQESIYFWMLVGVILGVEISITSRRGRQCRG